MDCYNRLIEYEKINKTQHIRVNDAMYAEVRIWSNSQRSTKVKLSKEKLQLLKAINFDLTPFDSKWNIWYEQLRKYKNKYNNVNITYRMKSAYKLSIWIQNQKRRFHKGTLEEDRITKLKEIGLKWIK